MLVMMAAVSCDRQSSATVRTITQEEADPPLQQPGEETSSARQQPPTMAIADHAAPWMERYTGSIDKIISVQVELTGMGELVRGSITYRKTNVPIMVMGHVRQDGNFFLREYQPDGLITGVMSGSRKGNQLLGKWYGTNHDKEYDLELSATEVRREGVVWPYEAKGSLAGKYGYHYPAESNGDPGAEGFLTVKHSGDQVVFTFDCVTGPPGYNMAMMEETAGVLKGNAVHYSSTEEGDCALVIRFFDGFAVVEHEGEKYDCGFGHNASVEGEFVKL